MIWRGFCFLSLMLWPVKDKNANVDLMAALSGTKDGSQRKNISFFKKNWKEFFCHRNGRQRALFPVRGLAPDWGAAKQALAQQRWRQSRRQRCCSPLLSASSTFSNSPEFWFRPAAKLFLDTVSQRLFQELGGGKQGFKIWYVAVAKLGQKISPVGPRACKSAKQWFNTKKSSM